MYSNITMDAQSVNTVNTKIGFTTASVKCDKLVQINIINTGPLLMMSEVVAVSIGRRLPVAHGQSVQRAVRPPTVVIQGLVQGCLSSMIRHAVTLRRSNPAILPFV